MDSAQIMSVNRQIYSQYPEFSGIKPSIQQQGDNFVLTYKTKITLNTGKSLNRNLRLVVDQAGNMLKISTSR